MASFHSSRDMFFDVLGDILAFKAGVLMSRSEIEKLLATDKHLAEIVTDTSEHVGMEYGELENIVEFLLHKLGRLKKRRNPPVHQGLLPKLAKDPKFAKMWLPIRKKFLETLRDTVRSPRKNKNYDPLPLIKFADEQFGMDGIELAMKMLGDVTVQSYKNPLSKMRIIEWKDTIELKDLFDSEGLSPQYGKFVDQRYIDYLHQNFEDIDQINWRKFEGLTAEYFEREGMHAEVGPGRDDDNIDVRVWPSQDAKDKPPAIIIQCKREKKKVSKVVVKALYADVLHEKASSGAVFTTTALSPGAKKMCTARTYPITATERDDLRACLRKMHQPGI